MAEERNSKRVDRGVKTTSTAHPDQWARSQQLLIMLDDVENAGAAKPTNGTQTRRSTCQALSHIPSIFGPSP